MVGKSIGTRQPREFGRSKDGIPIWILGGIPTWFVNRHKLLLGRGFLLKEMERVAWCLWAECVSGLLAGFCCFLGGNIESLESLLVGNLLGLSALYF